MMQEYLGGYNAEIDEMFDAFNDPTNSRFWDQE